MRSKEKKWGEWRVKKNEVGKVKKMDDEREKKGKKMMRKKQEEKNRRIGKIKWRSKRNGGEV